jgi:uncharacterized damage-inducible protein DinB
MRRICLIILMVTCGSVGLTSLLVGQEKPAEKAASAVPAAGPRAEFLDELAFYEQRYTRLAEAMPADKYAWKPGEGVRSVGDVFLHIAAANYGVARALGTPPPSGFDFKSFLAEASDKGKTVQALKESFAHLRQAIVVLKDEDMDKAQKMFGRQTTLRGSFMVITGHMGEHLGQSIAYARMNGIVPPWTEQQQQKAAEKPKQ